MTTTMIDRATLRIAVATLFTNDLVGAGKPVKTVYSYGVKDLKGESPVVTVSSAGSYRRNPEHSDRGGSLAFLDANIFVLYAEPTSGWTEANSDDRLDLIEKKIAEIVANNAEGPATNRPWLSLDFAGRSEITPVILGGKDYDWETIPLVLALWGA